MLASVRPLEYVKHQYLVDFFQYLEDTFTSRVMYDCSVDAHTDFIPQLFLLAKTFLIELDYPLSKTRDLISPVISALGKLLSDLNYPMYSYATNFNSISLEKASSNYKLMFRFYFSIRIGTAPLSLVEPYTHHIYLSRLNRCTRVSPNPHFISPFLDPI